MTNVVLRQLRRRPGVELGRVAGTGKSKNSYSVGRMMGGSTGEDLKKHRSRFPVGSGA